MRLNIIFLSSVRRPLQTILLSLLICFATFGFVSSITEYVTVRSETLRLGDYYQIIGVLLPKDTSQTDVTEGARFLADNPHISYADWRRIATGLLPEGMNNTDTDGVFAYNELYNEGLQSFMTYINDVLFYGTVTSKITQPKLEDDILTFKVDTVLFGRSEYLVDGAELSVQTPHPQSQTQENFSLSILPKANNPSLSPNDTSLIEETSISPEVLAEYPFLGLQVGQRYLVRARYDYLNRSLQIVQLQADGPAYIQVPNDTKVALSSEGLEKLRSEMKLLSINLRSMTLVSTYDMDAIPSRWEGARRLALTQGRWLCDTDSIEQNYVCLLHEDFAERYEYSIGDMISLQVLDSRIASLSSSNTSLMFENGDMSVYRQYNYVDYHGYITDNDFASTTYAETPLRLEVVGIYTLNTDITTTNDSNTIYIPECCMPDGFGGTTQTSADANLYSFVLNSYEDLDAFTEETREPLADMGLRVSVIDNNAEAFWSIIKPLEESKFISFLIYSLLLVLALALVTNIYIRPHLEEFAILRAFGLTRKSARYMLCMPIAIIGAGSISMSGLFAWNYAIAQALKTLANVQKGSSSTFAPPSIVLLAAFCLVVFVILMFFVYLSANHFSMHPVLELLQGNRTTLHRKKA